MTDTLGRLGYEAFEVTRVSGSPVQYTSRYPAWRPGADLPPGVEEQPTKTRTNKSTTTGVFGGVVYAQAPLAAARAIEFEEQKEQTRDDKKAYMGIHSIQGVFTIAGHSDRPFVHEVTPIHTGKSFATRLVQTRQPKEPSAIDETGRFNPVDATKELDGVCFTCLTTFKRSMPSPDDVQETQPPQVRFAEILARKRPQEWHRPYIVHIDSVQEQVARSGHTSPGTFPVLEMYRVDMTGHNAGKPVPERRELMLYRPLRPIPAGDCNAHVVCHAFEADRNGLTMLGCHLGYGHRWGRAASLSYAFYVHVNAEEAVMRDEGWWVQEASWPRVAAGRCTMVSRIWSPEGRHVASGYQDGMVVPEDSSRM
ncbi:acyl-CoA thioesterase [Cordyceps fumosorosea ARSEF 2679]|uniref:Acyl-CoA thioesterase n=1 Tax=Cordyceps fumosorosea (strain ARSEF 2679) TaxID=1081104 RepID=A0A167LIP9_CORFA|nr:acyl-CoA thioesterase [Cordyceps fumosorosea ARSEF 2679]OAA53132.1 acyl-CoA thioesterase [Cordyceps fumosorosea ARSEF 2679]